MKQNIEKVTVKGDDIVPTIERLNASRRKILDVEVREASYVLHLVKRARKIEPTQSARAASQDGQTKTEEWKKATLHSQSFKFRRPTQRDGHPGAYPPR